MKPDRAIIQFGGLGVGTHQFEFEVNDKFFEGLDYSEIKRANVLVTIELVKQNTVMTLNVRISGTVGITCDRCLAEFDMPVDGSESIYLKNGDVSESNDNIIVLPQGETEVDLTSFIYEMIAVALPIRRVPCELDADEYKCDQEMLDKISNLSVEEEPEGKTSTAMWDELKKLKFNNN